MHNKNGFSILELVVSFAICMVILVVLFQIVIVLRETYEKSLIKTELYNKQNLMIEQIYSDIRSKSLSSVASCGTSCITFSYGDGTTKRLSSDASTTILYGDYSTTLLEGTIVDVDNVTCTSDNGVISVSLPITHQLFSDEDFGIKIVHFVS